jgi:hypothetical protein
MTVAFATTTLPNQTNSYINQQHKSLHHHWHDLCICFD